MSGLKDAMTHYAPTRGIAMILGVGMLVWGVWVLLPFTSFVGPMYGLMLEISMEEVWGAVFAFGGFMLTAGIFNKDIDWIRTGSFIGFTLWAMLAILGGVSEPFAAPIVSRTIIALMHAWLYVQVKIHPELVSGAITITDLRDFKQKKEEDNE